MPKTKTLVLLFAFTLAGRNAVAQDTFEVQVAPGPGSPHTSAVFVGPGTRAELGLLAVEPFEASRPVLDAPYTADSVTEVTQLLADGNRIAHQTTASIARDSRGRIRREHQAMFLGPVVAERNVPLVSISDPAGGVHVTLDHERRVAHRMKGGPALGLPAGKGFDVAFRSGVAARRIGGSEGDVRTEELGERDIEGVRGKGTRTTITIPAGAIGNQLPIEVVSERWYSPELQVVLLTRRSDPRFGETIYRLTNIVRAEPSPDLFEVPPGFTTEEIRVPRPPRP